MKDIYEQIAEVLYGSIDSLKRMKAKEYVFSLLYSADFSLMEKQVAGYLANKKENLNMNKTFNIIDNGASVEPRFTLRYYIPDECNPMAFNKDWKCLVNLSPDEVNQLRETLDNISPTQSDDIQAFAKDFKRLAKKYSIRGRLDTRDIDNDYDSSNPSFMTIGKNDIQVFDFGLYSVSVSKTETVSA